MWLVLAAGVALWQRIEQIGTKIMDKIDELNAAEDQRDQAQTEAIARIREDVAELQREISARGNDPRLNELVARVQARTTELQQINPLPDFPAESGDAGTDADPANDVPVADGSGNVTPEGDTGHDSFGNPL